jgi:hypothetical protein
VIPIVRSREEPENLEVLRKALPKIIEGLHVAIRKKYVRSPMAKVDIRHDKYTAVVQDPRYFSEFFGLEASRIFKDTLGDDDVEALIAKPDRRLKEIGFNKVQRGVMYGYVDAIVLYIRLEDGHQGCGSATNIEKRARSALGEPVYNSCGLFEAIVGLAVFQVLLAPEIPLMESVACVTFRNEAIAACRIVHVA